MAFVLLFLRSVGKRLAVCPILILNYLLVFALIFAHNDLTRLITDSCILSIMSLLASLCRLLTLNDKIRRYYNDYKYRYCKVDDCVCACCFVVDVDFFAVEDAFLAEK